MQPHGRPLSRWKLAVFGFPALPHAFVALPLNIVIPAFYAAHTKVTLLQIGLVTSLTRVFDAVLDPLVGVLSDRIPTPLGHRKPWALAASVVCAIALFFLFQPGADATIAYYGVWSFVLYFGFSLFEIPRSAWSAEIDRDYVQRSRINSWVAQFNVVGSLVFWLTPILLFRATGTTGITAESLSAIAWMYAILMPAGLAAAAAVVPSGAPAATEPVSLPAIARAALSDRPLQLYVAAMAFWGLGQGASLSTTLMFISDRMGLAKAFPFLMIAFFLATVAAIPVWLRVARRIGRHRAWAIGLAGSVIARPLALLVAPGPGDLAPMIALTFVGAVMSAPSNFAMTALLSDVIDYDLWKSRSNKAGAFFALNALLLKASMAIGAGLAFALLDACGYRVGHANAGRADLGLLAGYMGAPLLLQGVCAFLLWRFPLDQRRQTIVRRRLDARHRDASRLAAALDSAAAG